ncbi:MAG TPA: nucleotidyltransferase family protein [Terracidiphilus sp.]|nr:nucleotidyltransferase family protein [Terracidiphilus sp.]
MEAIILAGGLGTRLRSRLTDLPKPMAPVAGRPFLQILLDQLLRAGCSRVLLSVGHLRHTILQSFGDAYRGMPIAYVEEVRPLGTGGAIRMALGAAAEPCVLVLNGDTYLAADLPALLIAHRAQQSPMTMAVKQVDNRERYGGVLIEAGVVVGFTEKGQAGSGWINAGMYVLSRTFPWLANLPERFSFEADVLTPMVRQIRPGAFPCSGYFLDIGVPEDLDRAQLELARDPADPPQSPSP